MQKVDIILYNGSTYNLVDPDTELTVILNDKQYIIDTSKVKKSNMYYMTCIYDDVIILLNDSMKNIIYIYVVLQHIYKVDTILKLSKLEWDYSKWSFEIKHVKMSSHAILLNYFLNLGNNFNKVLLIEDLDKAVKIPDKRGMGGERPRELTSQYGFPFYTPSTKKTLKKSERVFECPFPILPINFTRKAIVDDTESKKCFTCNRKEGEKDIFW